MMSSPEQYMGMSKAALDLFGITVFIGAMLAIEVAFYVKHKLFDKD